LKRRRSTIEESWRKEEGGRRKEVKNAEEH